MALQHRVQVQCSSIGSLRVQHFWHLISCCMSIPYLVCRLAPTSSGRSMQDALVGTGEPHTLKLHFLRVLDFPARLGALFRFPSCVPACMCQRLLSHFTACCCTRCPAWQEHILVLLTAHYGPLQCWLWAMMWMLSQL